MILVVLLAVLLVLLVVPQSCLLYRSPVSCTAGLRSKQEQSLEKLLLRNEMSLVKKEILIESHCAMKEIKNK